MKLAFLLSTTRTGVAMAATPNLALAGSTIASAHKVLLEKFKNRVGFGCVPKAGCALYVGMASGANL